MTVLLGFLFGVFVLAASFERSGRPFPFRWLMLLTTIVAASFYSLRVLS